MTSIQSSSRPTPVRALHHVTRRARTMLVALVAFTLVACLPAVAIASPQQTSSPKPTVVLVHGAFADSSSWNAVTKRLAGLGYKVIAPANPLRGLATDVQYLKDFLATVPGPIVLVGHSYGGFVMTNAATGDPDVKALVYIAAFAPDAGETIAGISASAPGALLGPDTLTVRPYTTPDGGTSLDGYITPTSYREVFAGDVNRADAWTYAVSQKPADLSILQTPSEAPAWTTIPTWTLVATQDHVIPPGAQRMMAKRANATTIEVTASHSVAVSKPAKVVAFIVRAAKSVG